MASPVVASSAAEAQGTPIARALSLHNPFFESYPALAEAAGGHSATGLLGSNSGEGALFCRLGAVYRYCALHISGSFF